MGKQYDMIDLLYEKANKEMATIKNIEASYKSLSYVRDIIYATSLRYKGDNSAFSVNKKLANSVEQIHYTIFHMCTFLYYETRHLMEYKNVTPMSLLDDTESRINAGLVPGRPLDELLDLWNDTIARCRISLLIARKSLKNDKSLEALRLFNKSAKFVTGELIMSIKAYNKKKRDALQSKF